MKILPINQVGYGRTGSLSANITVPQITKVLGFKPNVKDDPDKVRYSWGFTLDGERCGIWDYKGARWSFFGSDAALAKLEKALSYEGSKAQKLVRAAVRKVKASEKLDAAIKALTAIAAYTDEGANEHLRLTGSYGAFDEPSAVRIARETLARIGVMV